MPPAGAWAPRCTNKRSVRWAHRPAHAPTTTRYAPETSASTQPYDSSRTAEERFRRAYLHLSHSTASRNLAYMRPHPAFVAHREFWSQTLADWTLRLIGQCDVVQAGYPSFVRVFPLSGASGFHILAVGVIVD